LDLFIFEQSGERCLLRILSKMLGHVEKRCLSMEEKEVFDYINKGQFVLDCFKEIPLENLFRDDNYQNQLTTETDCVRSTQASESDIGSNQNSDKIIIEEPSADLIKGRFIIKKLKKVFKGLLKDNRS